MADTMQMTREEKETTRRGPRRVRVGYRPAAGQPRKYFEQEAPEGWHVRRSRLEGVYAMTTGFGRNDEGEEVNGQLIHLFDEGTDPMVIIDHLNYYEERIDAERMTLNDYLNREVG